MSITRCIAAAVLVWLPITAGPARAGDEAGGVARPAAPSEFTRAGSILGQSIFNARGERLGEVEELIVDPVSGRMEQAVIGIGGFLGIGQRRVAVPFRQIRIETLVATRQGSTAGGNTAPVGAGDTGPARPRFVVDLERRDLEAMPAWRGRGTAERAQEGKAQ